MKEFISRGLYNVPDASRILSLKSDAIIRWAFGYNRRGRFYEGITDAEVPKIGNRNALTFRELIQLLSVKEFRDLGVRWPMIRRAYAHGCRRFRTVYPFARKHWFADPGGIYYGEDDVLTEMSSEGLQGAMKKALEGYLKRMEFDDEGLVTRWYPLDDSDEVVLDPRISFGAPIVTGTGIRTGTLRGLADAGEDADSLAW